MGRQARLKRERRLEREAREREKAERAEGGRAFDLDRPNAGIIPSEHLRGP